MLVLTRGAGFAQEQNVVTIACPCLRSVSKSFSNSSGARTSLWRFTLATADGPPGGTVIVRVETVTVTIEVLVGAVDVSVIVCAAAVLVDVKMTADAVAGTVMVCGAAVNVFVWGGYLEEQYDLAGG